MRAGTSVNPRCACPARARGRPKPGGNTPEEFGRTIDDEYARWGKLVRERGIKMD